MQDLDLFPIPERRIILPVNMKVNYSTYVTLRVEDTKEASADSLVPEMMKVNSATDLAAMHVADQVRCCCCCCCCCSLCNRFGSMEHEITLSVTLLCYAPRQIFVHRRSSVCSFLAIIIVSALRLSRFLLLYPNILEEEIIRHVKVSKQPCGGTWDTTWCGH